MKIRDLLFKDFDPCFDGNCIIKKPDGGVVTNGGCHCLQNLSRTQLSILSSRLQYIADMELPDKD